MNSADFHTMLNGIEGEPEPHMALIQHGGFSKTRMFIGYRYGFGAKTFPVRILWLRCRRGYRYTQECVSRNFEISQPVLPARCPSPRERQDSSRYVKTESAIAFKSLSTDQGGLVNE